MSWRGLRLGRLARAQRLISRTTASQPRHLQVHGTTATRCHAAITAGPFRATPPRLATAGESSTLPTVGDTIYALSTAQGRAGIAVIRISGPSCLEVYRSLCPSKAPPKPRYATVRTLFEPQPPGAHGPAGILDAEALVLYFPAPKTVTGEDVLELHVHGGPATVKAVLAAIPRCCTTTSNDDHQQRPRVRYAEPGEFTKRAFFNDRLDLAQVESLSDALAADTEQQRRAAVRGTSGALGRAYERWRQQLLLARGELEALIDFSEDQHFDEPQGELLDNVSRQVADMLAGIRLHELGSQRSELLRGGIRIALVGPPNVGKSSLMNLVVGREASIVSGEAGTTRDIVEASLDIRGFLCGFADTAGFRSRESASKDGAVLGAVEEEGIRRARQKAQESDVVIVLASVEQGPNGPFIYYDKETLDLAAEADAHLVVVNKRDAVDEATFATLIASFRQALRAQNPILASTVPLPISCKQGQQTDSTRPGGAATTDPGGIQAVIDSLIASFQAMTEMPPDLQDLLGVTERQRQLLVKCRAHLEEFMLEARRPEDPDNADGFEADSVLAAEYLRYAADCLARITGKGEAGDVEDVLGVVFEKFCVGK
ncbi:mitochondrial splicing system protein [Purpureocillium takamizusanense]|uniref:Mitochondrial splicing system protein n=1 Tax=Purpureocillium takamizusanense TaxID=2060973 RepID=A0A9Q8VAF9_9HYPO|nr:mitochondrial splicing system protein [Purpureocillium takamizusanense]UNI18648.1 mitochondrial splicing system protein [Purpureocillium takamizusanense]